MFVVRSDEIGKLQRAAEIARIEQHAFGVPLIPKWRWITVAPDHPALGADDGQGAGQRIDQRGREWLAEFDLHGTSSIQAVLIDNTAVRGGGRSRFPQSA